MNSPVSALRTTSTPLPAVADRNCVSKLRSRELASVRHGAVEVPEFPDVRHFPGHARILAATTGAPGRCVDPAGAAEPHAQCRAAVAVAVEAVAEEEKVDIRLHTIIYNLTDEIKLAMTGLLAPVFKEVYQGKAEVRDTFRISKVGMVAGCFVQDGQLKRGSEIRLLRDNVVVHTGKVGSLRRFKDDVSEVRSGMECGVTLENYGDIKAGDIIEAFVTEKVAPEVFA